MRLDEVQEVSCDDSEYLPPYIFSYNGDFLPNRHTKAIDHWGYYNGVESNNTNFLNIPPTTVDIRFPFGVYRTEGNSDRETNEVEMKKGILERIDFPLGGFTELEFEANDYLHQEITNPEAVIELGVGAPCDMNIFLSDTHTFVGSQLASATGTTIFEGWSNCSDIEERYIKVEVYEVSTNLLIGEYEVSLPPKTGQEFKVINS